LAVVVLGGCSLQNPLPSPKAGAVIPSDRVVVHYMHRSFRCVSCLTIESQTRQALKESFSAELAAGEVEFHSTDYWADSELASRYGVDTVSVVVVVVSDGREVSFENLDHVWSLKGDAAELRAYIAGAVKGALAKARHQQPTADKPAEQPAASME
jgi:hypothetical protein